MSATVCPRCGAPQKTRQTDPLARCPWCGSLLAAATDLPALPMVAKARVAAGQALEAARRLLVERTAAPARLGTPRLVCYPFEIVASPRRPFRPLAPLPPALESGWRPSGADLVRETIEGTGENPDDRHPRAEEPPPLLDGIRIPVRFDPRPGATTVHYPFWRIPVDAGSGSALWVDAIDGQVIDGRPAEEPQAVRRADGGLRRWAFGALAAGAVFALLVPFPWSLVPLGLAGAWVWRGAWGS